MPITPLSESASMIENSSNSYFSDHGGVPPPLPFFSWKSAWGPLNIVPATLPVAALYLAPADVFDRFPLLRSFAEFVGKLVPRLSIHAQSTSLPQVSLLVDSLMVSVTAWVAIVVLLQTTLNYRYLLRRHMALRPHPMRTYLTGLVGIPLGFGMIAAHVMLAGGPSWAADATMGRTLFYGFLSFTLPLLAGWAIGGQLFVIRLFVDAHLFSHPVTIRLDSTESRNDDERSRRTSS